MEIEQYLQAGDTELRVEDIKTLLEEHNNMKQDIKRLKEEYMMLQNASDEVEEEKDKEIERLNNIINELDKELEVERKSRQLLTDDLAKVCEISLKKENIISKAIEYIENNLTINVYINNKEQKMFGYNKAFDDLLNILRGEDNE